MREMSGRRFNDFFPFSRFFLPRIGFLSRKGKLKRAAVEALSQRKKHKKLLVDVDGGRKQRVGRVYVEIFHQNSAPSEIVAQRQPAWPPN